MPKMKTNRGAAKRFKLKKNAIKRAAAFKNHILTKKSPRRKARLNAPHYVHSTNLDSIRHLLCLQ
ncbi:50S ribosomal protein L35 [Helicobacter sp. MIT 14-3879]|uniref:50S ribosomal protein L35 n=1 Tax=Helicobacter sp. MIT 14-3879 TaxID=2040649 RepID=UPI000E1EA9B6|nr:50S ribosomal protein L35 [Helicobacter sp. MIT 14-3879]RDU58216.1 50S ribosomal protein L35 [Helicobacter sp. MIT 14-3879]